MLKPIDLDLDESRTHLFPARHGRRLNRVDVVVSQSGNVVVFHQYRVVEANAMEHAATGPNRIFLDLPKAGRRLSGIHDHRAGPRHGVHEARGHGRHARSTPQQIEQRAFHREDRGQWATKLHHPRSGFDSITIDGEWLRFDGPGCPRRNTANDGKTAENTVLAGSEFGPNLDIGADECRSREIPNFPKIFGEPLVDGGIKPRGDEVVEQVT